MSLYKNLFNIEDVNIVKRRQTTETNGGDNDIDGHTLEKILKKATPEIRNTFSLLRDKTLGISDAVWEKVGAFYCDYRTSSTFASVHVQKNKLKVYIKMGDQKVNDPLGICKAVPKSYGYGLLNTIFDISKKKEIDYRNVSMKMRHTR